MSQKVEIMKKLLVSVLSIVTLVAIQSCTKANKPSGVSGTLVAEQEHDDFLEYKRSQANCGEIFRSLMDTFNSACDVFDDYVGDDVYMTMSYASTREFFAGDNNYDVY